MRNTYRTRRLARDRARWIRRVDGRPARVQRLASGRWAVDSVEPQVEGATVPRLGVMDDATALRLMAEPPPIDPLDPPYWPGGALSLPRHGACFA